MLTFADVMAAGGDLGQALGDVEERLIPGMRLEVGDWDPPIAETPEFGYAIVTGFVVRRLEIAGGTCTELLGPGDLFKPELELEDQFDMVPTQISWRAITATELAVLNDSFDSSTAARVALQDAILADDTRRAHALTMRLAIGQLPVISSRLHFMLWHLADRFGSVGGSGILVPIRMSTELLAELVLADVAEVRDAMRDMADGGLVSQAPRGWWLHGAPPTSSDVAAPRAASSGI